MNGVSLFSRRVAAGDAMYALADTPPHFTTRSGRQRVYVGADSYELMDHIARLPGVTGHCLELGSGSGIQLITALKQHPSVVRAVGMERDRRAVNVSRFNAALNGVDDRMVIIARDDDLGNVLEPRQASLAVSNPPFLAMPAWIDIDKDDAPLLSGDLRSLFPSAGWGGEDGLEVTKSFIRELQPLLASHGRAIIYSQFPGDESGPVLLQRFVEEIGGFDFGFEAIRSHGPYVKKAVHSASDAAARVAGLIVAAAMEKREPARVRVAIRSGSPEHGLLLRLTTSLEKSYQRLGITHFHDGFVTLTTTTES